MGELRSALLDAVTADDLTAVIARLVEQAKAGDVAAARLLLDRVFGPAVAIDFVERMERMEAAVMEERQR